MKCPSDNHKNMSKQQLQILSVSTDVVIICMLFKAIPLDKVFNGINVDSTGKKSEVLFQRHSTLRTGGRG